MARYEYLPIYKKALDLAVFLEQSVKSFSRYHKYTIGGDLRNHSPRRVRASSLRLIPGKRNEQP
jgi:hypothetical protein